jgi:hypothetical protein
LLAYFLTRLLVRLLACLLAGFHSPACLRHLLAYFLTHLLDPCLLAHSLVPWPPIIG